MIRSLTAYAILAAISLAALPGSAHAGDAAKGKTTFLTLCSSCHGNEGLGDGPTGMALPPEMKPRNLQTGEFKFATDDAKLKELLHKGGAAVGLNPLMTGAPGATEEDIENLVAFVRSLKK